MKNKKIPRHEVIQALINKIEAKSYLEIGIGNAKGFKKRKCSHKVSVDPCVSDGAKLLKESDMPTYKMESDKFFAQNKESFDVIFIDGLHIADQVKKDIINSLNFLNHGGFIVCHDMSPITKDMQSVPKANVGPGWTGDCWKAWVNIRSHNPNLKMFVVDTDLGCGVIQRGAQELLDLKGLELTYENLNRNRKEWLNLISVEDFEAEYL